MNTAAAIDSPSGRSNRPVFNRRNGRRLRRPAADRATRPL